MNAVIYEHQHETPHYPRDFQDASVSGILTGYSEFAPNQDDFSMQRFSPVLPKDCELYDTFSSGKNGPQDTMLPSSGLADQNATEKELSQCLSREKEITTRVSASGRRTQVTDTLRWLGDNYELQEGVCLPRCILYTHYLDMCKKADFTPIGSATFGKLIRQKYPKITTRRLGTRGQSKYHYYGLGIKESSMYYLSVYSGKGLTRFSSTKVKTEGSSRKYSLSSKTGTLLPDFPEADHLLLPQGIPEDKVQTFTLMYRTHCQRILDTVISANFDEVEHFLLHFWQGMPGHLTDVLDSDVITEYVSFCDGILYNVLLDVLIPSSIQDLPESLATEIRSLVRRLPVWLRNALETTPEKLRRRKMQVALDFIRNLRRQTTFVHVAQTARGILSKPEMTSQMAGDFAQVDLTGVTLQLSSLCRNIVHLHLPFIKKCFSEFFSLISKPSDLDGFTEWLDSMVEWAVLKPCRDAKRPLKERASQFCLQWSLVTSLILRELTLNSAGTFEYIEMKRPPNLTTMYLAVMRRTETIPAIIGAFHLLHIMCDEYIFLVMDTQEATKKGKEALAAMKGYLKTTATLVMNKYGPDTVATSASPQAKKRKVAADDEEEIRPAKPEPHVAQPILAPTPPKPGRKTAFVKPVPHVPRTDVPPHATSHRILDAHQPWFESMSPPIKNAYCGDKTELLPDYRHKHAAYTPYMDFRPTPGYDVMYENVRTEQHWSQNLNHQQGAPEYHHGVLDYNKYPARQEYYHRPGPMMGGGGPYPDGHAMQRMTGSHLNHHVIHADQHHGPGVPLMYTGNWMSGMDTFSSGVSHSRQEGFRFMPQEEILHPHPNAVSNFNAPFVQNYHR